MLAKARLSFAAQERRGPVTPAPLPAAGLRESRVSPFSFWVGTRPGPLSSLRSCLVVSNSLQPQELQPIRLLCPWNSPGKNTGVGCHSLLKGVFPTQGSNPGLLHCKQILYSLRHQGSPLYRVEHKTTSPSPHSPALNTRDSTGG